MISVCIPVFNVDVRKLAALLSDEICSLNIPAEAIFMDDGSGEKYLAINREIGKLPGVTYEETHENRGRAAIRNLLGKRVNFPWLLFLDADSLLPGKEFLTCYVDAMEENTVVCGGTIYQKEPPEDTTLRLRWTYGIHREQLSAGVRNQRNSFTITSNNFLILRDLFLKTGFREEIKGYGHEDTVLGYDLFRKRIRIKHIDNPVLHTGLESSAEYLGKTRSALKNLLFIEDLLAKDSEFTCSSGMLRRLHRLEAWHLIHFVSFFFRLLEPLMEKNLTSAHPSLLFFDLYRLGYLCQCKSNSLSGGK